MRQDVINKVVLLILVAVISLLFLTMIQQFLVAIFMAAVFAAMTHPIYLKLSEWFGGRHYLASIVTLLLLLFTVLIPVVVLSAVFVGQAVNVGQSLTPIVVDFLKEPGSFAEFLQRIPFYEELLPYEDELTSKVAASVEALGKMLVGGLSSIALGTVNFLFVTVVFFYTLFFFLIDGKEVVEAIRYYLPLEDRDERVMLNKFTSVTQAMVTGTLLIGVLQGALAGIAFAIAGLPNAVFWGTVMAVLSIIPGIGSALVWAPASVILLVQGNIGAGIGLFAFCALVVGSIDNVLRPILVGKHTDMHELMIFFGTLGGLFMFGMAGLLIGPVIASLFITIWEIYGEAFKDLLPAVNADSDEAEGETAPAAAHQSPNESDEEQAVIFTDDETDPSPDTDEAPRSSS
ncbi:AI-2E family transporter [Halochromatium glycolicum]|uniref:AI-2E family transporter n=1 Tax=Halochromatium glycolicum TaxID=85075 RepID=A0AAJ0U4T6_9GAMM|nr:AI-2E family transporter [Halochromatium glycolicum]MBK1705296.1 AI-2E family transporter [Halochromatium glycolicum]